MLGAQPYRERALGHPEFDRAWALLQDLGLALCFHVSAVRPPLDPAWYALDPSRANRLLDMVFLHLPAAVAVTSLIVHGVLERFPRLRIGIVELSAGWVPGYLLHLDGAFEFYRRQNGAPLCELPLRPSEYFRRQVRVNAFALEAPARLMEMTGSQLYMWGSDYPHAEGMKRPSWRDYLRVQPRELGDAERESLGGGNAEFLLGLAG
jgi:predicted TIM-barrel fold metal-dependent hydrolase